MTALSERHLLIAGRRLPLGVLLLWILVLASVPITLALTPSAWDVRVYQTAMTSLAAGHDPYADAMAIQRTYHAQAVHPAGDPPYSYVYSPITLPVLKALNRPPLRLTGVAYWSLYAAGLLACLGVGFFAAEPSERTFLLYLAPVTLFFPGLLANGTVLGGNVVTLLYGAVLLTALYGWRRHRWLWFYLAVLLASCVKAPLLSLVAIPYFSEAKQAKAVATTVGLSIGLFALTPLVWPVLFRHYLQAVELQFSFNHDFGCSPAGLLSELLLRRNASYPALGLAGYCAYAVPLLLILRHLSRRFLVGVIALEQWIPVLLAGTLLLNPRLIEYDLAAITLPLALLARRFCARTWGGERATIRFAILLVAANLVALGSWHLWKGTACVLLLACFISGCMELTATGSRVPEAEGRKIAERTTA